MSKDVELTMHNASRRSRTKRCVESLTWNILDDLPILDGRSHLDIQCTIVPRLTQVVVANCVLVAGKYRANDRVSAVVLFRGCDFLCLLTEVINKA